MTLPIKTATTSWPVFVETITDPRVVASYRLSLGASLAAAGVNAVFGMLVAWVLVRYDFPGRRIVDALIDLPFALPTAVAGITLTAICAPNGWLGAPLARYGITLAFTPLGVTIALVFIGLPFVVRTLQPVLEDLDLQVEEAATSLGASRWGVIRRVILPYLYPAWLTGFALAFARAIGEYGSVVFISGNMPMRTEISPLLIVTKLEQYDYAGATAVALVMLCCRSCCCWPSTACSTGAAAGWRTDDHGDDRLTPQTLSATRSPAAFDRAGVPALAAHCGRARIPRPVSRAAARPGVLRGVRERVGRVSRGDHERRRALGALADAARRRDRRAGQSGLRSRRGWAIAKFRLPGTKPADDVHRPAVCRVSPSSRASCSFSCSAGRGCSARGWTLTI